MTSKGHSRGTGSTGQQLIDQSTPVTHHVGQGHSPRPGTRSTHLNTPSSLYRNSRSLDSGLDEFGAVPFAATPSTPQNREGHSPHSQPPLYANQVDKISTN